MPGLRPDESPHAIHRRFSESSDLPLIQPLIRLCRKSKVVLVQQMEHQWWWSSKSAKQGSEELARLLHDELIIQWLLILPWRQRNIRECRIGAKSDGAKPS